MGVADAGMRPKLCVLEHRPGCVLEHRPSHVDFLSVINYNKTDRDKMKVGRNNEEWCWRRKQDCDSEIMCLIQNGFTDGAYARWRSLCELRVVASFIKKYGSQVAEEYVKSSGSKVRNEWARRASCFRGKKKSSKISFKDLFDNSDINEAWNKEYQFTNLLVHGSSDGTFSRLGTYGNTQVMSVGRSDWGMSISAFMRRYP